MIQSAKKQIGFEVDKFQEQTEHARQCRYYSLTPNRVISAYTKSVYCLPRLNLTHHDFAWCRQG